MGGNISEKVFPPRVENVIFFNFVLAPYSKKSGNEKSGFHFFFPKRERQTDQERERKKNENPEIKRNHLLPWSKKQFFFLLLPRTGFLFHFENRIRCWEGIIRAWCLIPSTASVISFKTLGESRNDSSILFFFSLFFLRPILTAPRLTAFQFNRLKRWMFHT